MTLLVLAGCGKMDMLSNLPEQEVNEIVSIMQQYKIPVAKKAGSIENMWTVVLNDIKYWSKATEILSSKGYPHRQYNTIGDVFQKSGLVSSPLEERARFMYALSESIAATLKKIPGVLTSEVHIVLPEEDAYMENNKESSAAIMLTYKSGGNLDESVREIKYLVANSVEGLDYDRVSIAMFPVSFEDADINSIEDNSVNILGVNVAPESAPLFYALTTLSVVIILVLGGGLGYMFYLQQKRNKKKAGSEDDKDHDGNQPVAVQSDEENADELDETAKESAEGEQ